MDPESTGSLPPINADPSGPLHIEKLTSCFLCTRRLPLGHCNDGSEGSTLGDNKQIASKLPAPPLLDAPCSPCYSLLLLLLIPQFAMLVSPASRSAGSPRSPMNRLVSRGRCPRARECSVSSRIARIVSLMGRSTSPIRTVGRSLVPVRASHLSSTSLGPLARCSRHISYGSLEPSHL